MQRDRSYYRCLSAEGLLLLAKEEGIDPEMAIVLAEFLHAAERPWIVGLGEDGIGTYQFNHRSNNA